MKRELKIGDSHKITISDSGAVFVPDDVRMTICEIGDLLGIYYQTAKRNIRAIEQLGVATGDYTMCCTVHGRSVHPEYYGLEMITALAFRVQSARTAAFRRWIIRRITEANLPRTILLSVQNPVPNQRNTNIFH